MKWPFKDNAGTVAVTSSDVVDRKTPILYVIHETDEDGEIVWQFHYHPNRFDFATARLVRLETMLTLDDTISELGDLPVGWQATRKSIVDKWVRIELESGK